MEHGSDGWIVLSALVSLPSTLTSSRCLETKAGFQEKNSHSSGYKTPAFYLEVQVELCWRFHGGLRADFILTNALIANLDDCAHLVKSNEASFKIDERRSHIPTKQALGNAHGVSKVWWQLRHPAYRVRTSEMRSVQHTDRNCQDVLLKCLATM
jgi:hypothetical protein